ncbi:hypothetical protein Tco_0316744 [Tanacetum coccineum]
MNEDYYEQNSCYHPNSFDFDQYQPPQFPVNYPPQETSNEILQAHEDLMEAIEAFLKEYDHIPPNEKCMALLLAEERFLKIKQAMEEEQNQPEVMQELLLKLMDDFELERETEEITDEEQNDFQGSTAQIPPPVIPKPIPEPEILKTLPKSTPIPEPEIPKTVPKANIPYPSRRDNQKNREKASYQKEKIFQMFQDLRFDISFADALFLMPRFAPT